MSLTTEKLTIQLMTRKPMIDCIGGRFVDRIKQHSVGAEKGVGSKFYSKYPKKQVQIFVMLVEREGLL